MLSDSVLSNVLTCYLPIIYTVASKDDVRFVTAKVKGIRK